MRLHTFTLVVFTAVLAHSANSAKTSDSAPTEGAPSASLRSSDACCDDVPVEQVLSPHETTAGEARMPGPSPIDGAVARLVETVHARYPTTPVVDNVYGLRAFDVNAIEHFLLVEAAHKTPEKLLEMARELHIRLQGKPEVIPKTIAEARQFLLAHQAKRTADAKQDLLAHQAQMTAEAQQSFFAHQAEMRAEAHQYFLAHQAERTADAQQYFLAHQAGMTEQADKSFLAHQAKMTAEAQQYLLANQALMTADAQQYLLAHQWARTAEAKQDLLAHQAERSAKARPFFLAHQAEMTAEARQSFLAHQAERTAKDQQHLLAHQALMTAEAQQSFVAHQAKMTADAQQIFIAHQAGWTAEAQQYFLEHQAARTAEAQQYFLAHRAEMTAEAQQSFVAHQAKMTADAQQSFVAHQAGWPAEAHQYFLAHQAEMTAKAQQYFLAQQAKMTAEAQQSFVARQAERIAQAHQYFLAHQGEITAEAEKRFELVPSALFSIMLEKAKANAPEQVNRRMKSYIETLDLGYLNSYRKTYNALEGRTLTLRNVLSTSIEDDAELAPILSILERNDDNKEYVVLVRNELFADWKTVEGAAVKLRIPKIITGVLRNKNVETFVLFIGTLAREAPALRPVIVEQLTKRVGNRQAALLVYKMQWMRKLAFNPLKATLFEYFVERGTTPYMLNDDIVKARAERLDGMVETRHEELLLHEYSAHYEVHARKTGKDTSAGPS